MPNDLNSDLHATTVGMGEAARAAARSIASSSTHVRNHALEAAAEALVARERAILAANAKDVKAARAEGNDDAFIDRLTLTAKAIEGMAEGLRQIVALPD